jgi:predicted SnoaL-like aldol condensation-catalyzing enzyme
MRLSDHSQKLIVAELYRDVLGGGRLDRLDALVAPAYVPHLPMFRSSPTLGHGIDALKTRLLKLGPMPNRVARIIADGDRVFAHVKYKGKIPVAGADVFRFDASGKIGAHWNVRQPLPRHGDQGDERFASHVASDATPLHSCDWLKARVRQMLVELWSKGNADLVPEFYAPSYVQHNVDMPGGFQRIKEIVQTDIRKYIETTGGPFPVDIHSMGAEGDMVFVHLSIFMAGINRHDGARSTNVDIFRVDRYGKMVEHWDVLEMERESRPDENTLY